MARNEVRLPDDTLNTGKRVRTWQRTLDAVNREEHFFHEVHGETSSLANVAISATNVTLRAANVDRIGLVIFNDGDIESLYVKLGATASVTSFTAIVPPGVTWVLPVPYAGLVDGLWSGTTGTAAGGGSPAARVSEITP